MSREAGREKETSMTTIVRVSPTEELQETEQALIQGSPSVPASDVVIQGDGVGAVQVCKGTPAWWGVGVTF